MANNRYDAPCGTCGTNVPAGEGRLGKAAGRWVVTCQRCDGAFAVGLVTLTLRGGEVLVGQQGRLSNDQWAARQAACRGLAVSRRVNDRWQTKVALADTPELARRLAEQNVPCELSKDLQAALAQLAGEQKAEIAAADARADAVDAILAQYGKSLYAYQRTGVSWLAPRESALLADDMGLGKTIQALCAAPAGSPLLVICPAVAKGVWLREVKRWRPDITKIEVLKGRGSFRWPTAGEMIITNYDVLPQCEEVKLDRGSYEVLPAALLPAPAGCVVIADEAHALKSGKAQRTKRFRAISRAAREVGGRVWLLTATPMLNRPPELWSLLQAGGPQLTKAFSGWKTFCRCFGADRTGYRGTLEWGSPTPEVAERLKTVQLRRLKSEVLTDLPAKRYDSIEVNGLSKALIKTLDKVAATLAAAGIDLATATAEALKAQHGVVFEGLSKARAALATAKIPALLETIEPYEEAGESLVVFSAHRAPVDALATRPGWAAITGDTPADQRSAIEAALQSGQLKGVAATIQAGGVAITLTRAAVAIFVDRLFTPSLNSQAEDRIYRIGQSRGVQIIDLVAAHALDRRLYQILATKQELIDDAINAAAGDQEPADLQAALDAALAALADQPDPDVYRAAIARIEAQQAQQAARNGDSRWSRIVRERGKSRGLDLGDVGGPRYAATDPRDIWAADALRQLASDDTDHAQIDNGIGFNKADGWLGHQLAQRADGGLTKAEWKLAHALLRKYHGQVGVAPKAE